MNVQIKEYIKEILSYIGEDYEREGLQETPNRIINSWKELYRGYNENPDELLKTFEPEGYNGLVLLKDCEFYSTCEHHMLPFHGKAHIAYIPNGRIIGVSKLARLLEIYTRRLQVQERIGEQVVSFLMQKLKAQGAACILEAQHFCMTSRGIQKQGSKMVTSTIDGTFFIDNKARQELYDLIKS